jgi:hypothetical protein
MAVDGKRAGLFPRALSRLNAPALGAPLYEFWPQVADMKRRALAALQAMAMVAPATTPPQGDDLF